MDPCTFLDMETLSIGLYPSREGHRSFYGPLHISGHGNSIHWPVSLQGGALEFLSTDPCTFLDMETLSIGLYPSREGHQSFYGPLHISGHGNSVHWPISLQGGAPEFLSMDPCTFLNMEK